MKRRIAAVVSIAVVAGVGITTAPASAQRPACPYASGFAAVVASPGYAVALDALIAADPEEQNAASSCK